MDFNAFTSFDWVVAGLLLTALAGGWLRGIVRTLLGFVSFFIAVMLAGRLTGPVMRWLNEAFGVQDKITEGLLRRSAISPESAAEALSSFAIPDIYRRPLVEDVITRSAEAGDLLAVQHAAEQLAAGVSTGVCFIVLVLVLSIAIRWVGGLFADVIQSLPLVGTADRLLGAAAMGIAAILGLSLFLIWVIPTLSVYGAAELGAVVNRSVTPPYIIQAFEWTRGLVLGGGLRLWSE
ncbi:putative membrane protein required for colicin V production [Symbiobacterium terraclitae]|uniref:Membrane protein required for colicin V production n=1 Tax=Symbiobacterium terraclitae TaxID=557451 RepID=A0ABS4JVB3_9FIRM|nr:putative membrane protein required for colicin V production [Symbiobacterium terraclitae]